MQITATEFKNNIGKYLALASQQDIYITKNGRSVAKLSNHKRVQVCCIKEAKESPTIACTKSGAFDQRGVVTWAMKRQSL